MSAQADQGRRPNVNLIQDKVSLAAAPLVRSVVREKGKMLRVLKVAGLILLALAAAIVFFIGSLGLDVHWTGE